MLSPIVSERVFDVLTELVAVTVTLNDPAAVGVPEIFPVVEHDNPPGSPDAVHVIGVVPVAVRVTE